MKIYSKIIYCIIGILGSTSCSECNNLVSKDPFGGNGDNDSEFYIHNFDKCSKNFKDFIKYYGKPGYLQGFYTEKDEKYGNFEDNVLDERAQKIYDLINARTLSDAEKKEKNKLLDNVDNQRIVDEFYSQNFNPETPRGKEIESKINELLKDKSLWENRAERGRYIFRAIKDPISLENVKIKSFTSYTTIKVDEENKSLKVETIWEITVDKKTTNGCFIKIHEYYFNGLENIDGFCKKEDKMYVIDFSKTDSKTIQFKSSKQFNSENISLNFRYGVIPKEFLINGAKITLKIEDIGYHLTHRFPFLKKIESGVYQYVISEDKKNVMNIDLQTFAGISTDDFLTSDIKINYTCSGDIIGEIKGSTPIYNGPYIFKPCEIFIEREYDRTNLPDGRICPRDKKISPSLYIDQEFFISGINSNKIILDFKNLQMNQDIEERKYKNIDDCKKFDFGDDSNNILRPYTLQILNLIFGINQNETCTCTKVAALSKFVHNWMIYDVSDTNHTLSPVKLFITRKGVCIDYTHLLMGLCSSIGINNIMKVSGVGVQSSNKSEKHSWCYIWCPECNHVYEFDPTWGNCYQLGPDHVFLSQTSKVNDIMERARGGELSKTYDISLGTGKNTRKITVE